MDQRPPTTTRRPTVPPFSTPAPTPAGVRPVAPRSRPFFTPPGARATALAAEDNAHTAPPMPSGTQRSGKSLLTPSDSSAEVLPAQAAEHDENPMLDALFAAITAEDVRPTAHPDMRLELAEELETAGVPEGIEADLPPAAPNRAQESAGGRPHAPSDPARTPFGALHTAEPQDGVRDESTADSVVPVSAERPHHGDAGRSMVVDYSDVVGSSVVNAEDPRVTVVSALGDGVFSAIVPWDEPAEGSTVSATPERVAGDLRFPELTAYRSLVDAIPESPTGAGGGDAAVQVDDPEAWDPVPDSPLLRQIVQGAASAGNAEQVAAVIASVAERIRRGELVLPANAAEGEAAALALALAAILQPGRSS